MTRIADSILTLPFNETQGKSDRESVRRSRIKAKEATTPLRRAAVLRVIHPPIADFAGIDSEKWTVP